MIPLSNDSRRSASFPIVTVSIIVINVIVFVLELIEGDAFLMRWALAPADIVAGRNWITLLTSIFMHGGWLHILSNMVFLWVFGPSIEEAMGGGRYLVFYLLGGLAASLAQIAVAPNSTALNLGASGAIAAVMGAFIVTYPNDQIRAVVFLGKFGTITQIRAIVLIGIWFLSQVVSGMGVLATTEAAQDGVAYMAHVGGFLFGVITARFFQTPQQLPAGSTSGRSY
jgi:membrane associated rhomboid family serine protease